MRCDQYIGLNPWATKLVKRKIKVHDVVTRTFPGGKKKRFAHWHRISVARVEKISTITGAFTSVVADLHRYTFPDGRVFEEFVQVTPWSGGPCYFIALKDKTGAPVPNSLWSEEEHGCV